MKDARLYGANFEGTVLNGADLTEADLSSSMSCPDTGYRWSEHDVAQGVCDKPIERRRTNLKGASLRGANLQGADLNGADLTCAVLLMADLRGAKNLKQDQLNVALGGALTRLPQEPPEMSTPRQGEVLEVGVGVEAVEWPCHWEVAGAGDECSGPRDQPECDRSVWTAVRKVLAQIRRRFSATPPPSQPPPPEPPRA